MLFPIEAQRPLCSHRTGAQSHVAAGAFVDLKQDGTPLLLKLGNLGVTADGFDLLLGVFVRGE